MQAPATSTPSTGHSAATKKTGASSVDTSIPTVHLAAFTGQDAKAREDFINAVGDALRDVGFLAIADHQVDLDLIARAYALIEEFFTLPAEVKKKYEREELKGQRGFISYGREHAKDAKAADLKEFWQVGRELAPGETSSSPYGGNIWPTEIPAFQPTMVEFYSQLEQCASTLVAALSLYIGEDPDFLPSMMRGGDTSLRLIHYPPVDESADPASIRAAAHEDINMITLLCESTAPGLELLERDGSWRPISAQAGQIVADSGDMIQNLTNGYLRSTTHRVVNPDNSRERRFSMPFFVHPRSEASLNPRPGCIEKTGGQKTFRDLTAGQYLAQRLAEIGLM